MSTEVKYSVFCLIYSKYFTYCAFFLPNYNENIIYEQTDCIIAYYY